MTNTVVVIGGHTVSDYVIDVDTWGNKLTQVGTCKLVLDNTNDFWGDDFEPNDAISITIDGAVIWTGFVDDVIPSLGTSGVNVNEVVVKGRNQGRFLGDFEFTKNYKEQESGVIIGDILDGVGNPLLYTDPTGTPVIKYNVQRTKLGDAFNDISSLVGYDYYIDINGRLHYFLAGTSDSGVNLISIVGGAANNLLSFTEYEKIGFDIKNVIKVHAGSVKDHWSDETALSWGNLSGVTVVTDETDLFMNGVASLKAVAAGADVTFGLDFTVDLHGYTTIDMTRFGQAKVVFIPEDGSTGNYDFRPVLHDGEGTIITFTRTSSGAGSKGFTERYNAGLFKWRTLSFPIGLNRGTVPETTATSGWWHYTNRVTVTRAGLYTAAELDADNGSGQGTIEADGGTPFSGLFVGETIELENCDNGGNNGEYVIFSVTDTFITLTTVLDGGDTAADITIDILTEFDWSDVVKLGFQLTTAAGMDTIYVDALYLPSIEALNSTTNDPVSVGLYGSRTLTEYRKQLRSQKELDDYAEKVLAFRKDPIQKFKAVASGQTGTKYVSQVVDVHAPTHGIPALTPYIIVSVQHSLHNNRDTRGWDYTTKYDLVAQDTDPMRVLGSDNYFQAYLLQQAQDRYNQQRAITDDEFWLGDIETGITPQLTSGAVQPTDANEGDRFYDSTLDIEYEFTGGIWVPIVLSSAALDISLKPWTSNFSLIWDDATLEPPVDWNHFKWGSLGNENTGNATIAFGDGTTKTINFGQDAAVGDGVWWVYWDDGNNLANWTQVYSVASGTGLGVLAQVFVDNGNAPSVLMYNSYVPTAGFGSVVAHAIKSVHISSDEIIGKNFITAAGVQWAAGGNPGVITTSAGLRGKGAAGAIMVELLAADGKFTAAGGSIRLDSVGLNIITDTATQFIIFRKDDETIKGAIYKDTNDYMIFHSTEGRLRMRGHTIPLADGGFNLGLDAIRWDTIYGDTVDTPVVTSTPTITVHSDNDVVIDADGDVDIDGAVNVLINAGTTVAIESVGDTTIDAHDDFLVSADDNVAIDAGTGDVVVTAGDDVTLQPTDDLRLNPAGTILVNGLTTYTGTQVFDDNAGSTHTVVVLKGLIRSWTVT